MYFTIKYNKFMRKTINYEDVVVLLQQGKTYQEIADILNFTRNSIGRFCRKHFNLLQDRGKSTRQSLEITQQQKEILFGGLLGDTCLVPHNKTFRGSENHSTKQEDYCKYKYNLLQPLVGKFRYTIVKLHNKEYTQCAFTIRPNIQLENLYDIFYKNFNCKKDVPHNLSLLTPLAISIWFMDDGFLVDNGHSQTLGFSTCSFSLEGLQRLQLFLKNTYNIETIIRKNFYLVVRKSSAITLKRLIEPYIIDTMKYKLGSLD